MSIAGDSDHSHFDGDGEAPAPIAPIGAVRRPPRTAGKLFMYIILASQTGLWKGLYPTVTLGLLPGQTAVLGIVAARWTFITVDDAQAHPQRRFFHLASQHVRCNTFGS
jgi:hypothetical protein